MGITVYSLLWVMQDLYHQPYGHQERKVPAHWVVSDYPIPRDSKNPLIKEYTLNHNKNPNKI